VPRAGIARRNISFHIQVRFIRACARSITSAGLVVGIRVIDRATDERLALRRMRVVCVSPGGVDGA